MRRILARCLVAATLVGGALMAPTTSLAHPEGPPAQPGKPELVDVTTLPKCVVKPWKGFATPEEAAAIPDDAPVCMSPQDMVETIAVGRQGPHPSPVEPDTRPPYKHNGVETYERYKGIEATILVTNPSVDHNGTYNEFVVSRVMGKAYRDRNWLEAGWAEVSWHKDDDTRYVYTYTDVNNPDGTWRFYPGYGISASLYYKWRVDRCYGPNNVIYTCASLYWGGAWHVLTYGDYGCTVIETLTDGERCYGEAMTEIYSTDGSPTPSIATHNRVDWGGVHVRRGTAWYNFTDLAYPVETDPYVVCWQAQWYDFSVHRYSC